MRKTGFILSILAFVTCLQLMSSCSDAPKFSRDTRGFAKDREDRHSPWFETTSFHEHILVSNFPQDSLEQLKLMLWYADKITSGFQTPRKMKNKTQENLTCYKVWFLDIQKKEGETFRSWLERRIFIEQKFGTMLIGNVSFCQAWCDDPTKWELTVVQKYKTESDGKPIDGSRHIDIFNECRPISKEGRDGIRLELISYYEDLQNERKSKK